MLTIGLLNNMPDAAMQSVERQLCSLLSAASGGLTVRLKLFAAPDSRSPVMQSYVDAYYEPFETLEEQDLDALIVTGTEPKAVWLEDEPAWPTLSRVADWAEVTQTPVLWSCLAAHAAAYRLGGVHRRPLARKLSGLFLCRRKQYVRGLARNWLQPHSRFYGVDERALVKAGFRIISGSPETGPDTFLLRQFAEHLFLQGHPEYGFSTLPAEFRRDVERFLNGQGDYYPEPPAGYYGRAVLAKLAEFQRQARGHRDPALIEAFDTIACHVAAEYSWRPVALHIYGTWLKRVARLQARRGLPARTSLPGRAVALHGAGVFARLGAAPSVWSA